MKLNGALLGKTDQNNLNDGYLGPTQTNYISQYAQYFVKYIKAFAAQGVTVNAITLQNEPLWSSSTYPTMYMYDYEQGQLIQYHIGPALAKAGLSTSIWAYDHNTDVPSYPQNVLNIARQYTSAVSWHCYAGNLDWSFMSDFRNKNPGVTQYMSECWTPPVGASNWFQAANFTIGLLQNWAAGVMAWGLATDASHGPHLPGGCTQCRGLVTINKDGTYTFNIAYYLMAQFSRFMPRSAVVLKGTGSSKNQNAAGIQSVATMNPDKTRTVVIMNTFTNDVYVTLNVTSGQPWSGNVLASSIVTWVLPAT
ncbi:Putative glycoside hydrolase family 30, glycosyl hydrolase, all-beta [Septoria linicola]|uniref:Glycoside hydrolase family 30, glycosyl hydrolase, all-beta n=1 Tax=Septoria linicola TaxID=215465 RepID=A0A9Q9ASS8_9PEZI|nr:putative glycoside hydrolase family 30, glycosyl hydrolase, all-beta [Septoria linicola]USW55147.1 Putative glycoside hydrolase family 30, glycosyl hydrolase, all-beta [Septoria linicola]